jgi:glutamate-1-semialdehyde 2,1-aminomutase
MEPIASGEVVHAGTLNGNPLCLAAARATIDVLAAGDGSVFRGMRTRADRLREGIAEALKGTGLPFFISGDGPVFQISFIDGPAENYRDTLRGHAGLYGDFALGLLDEGVLALPDGRWYLSAAHTDDDIDRTIEAVRSVCAHTGS